MEKKVTVKQNKTKQQKMQTLTNENSEIHTLRSSHASLLNSTISSDFM